MCSVSQEGIGRLTRLDVVDPIDLIKNIGGVFMRESARASTGLRVKALRAKLDVTQARFAELMDVSVVTISRWETGQSTPSTGALGSNNHAGEE
jgi:DNA-binding XRE family transcriptional regulator